MTQLAFHFGAPDKLAYASRLLRKAVNSGARVLALAPPAACASLDLDLWALGPTEFLPHGDDTAPQAVQTRSPLVLTSAVHAGHAQQGFGVLVNLSDAMPDHFEAFARVIEVVSLDPQDRDFARMRWARYKELGCAIERHDLQRKGNS